MVSTSWNGSPTVCFVTYLLRIYIKHTFSKRMPDPLIYSFSYGLCRQDAPTKPCGTWLKNNVAFFPATGSARPFSRPLLPVMPAWLDHAASWMCGVDREAVTISPHLYGFGNQEGRLWYYCTYRIPRYLPTCYVCSLHLGHTNAPRVEWAVGWLVARIHHMQLLHSHS